MPDRTDIVYRYDGSFDGLLCCVFDSFARKEDPAMLLSPRSDQTTLFPAREVETDPAHAQRVARSIPGRISLEALELAEQAPLCCAPDADLYALRFLRLGFRVGAGALDMLAEPCVDQLFKALRHLWGEAHLLCGFIRFSDTGGALTATIQPKNRVLPLLRDHFTERYNAELFMIYDQTHGEALVHQNGASGIYPVERLDLPELSDREQYIRALWQRFYGTIGIKERENPKCRMTHMPKRYWAHMLEMEPELNKNAAIEGAKPREIWYNRGEVESLELRV